MWRLVTIAATFVALGADGAEVPRLPKGMVFKGMGPPMNQWIGVTENLQDTNNFPIKYRVVP